MKIPEFRKYARLCDLVLGLFTGRHIPIVVYSMGKVGSLAVYRSLQKCGARPVFFSHTHVPSESARTAPGFDFMLQFYTPRFGGMDRNLHRWTLRKDRRIDFITMVREPVARNISDFFQNFKLYTGVDYEANRFTTDELARIFMDKFRHLTAQEWFDREMKGYVGIDVYADDFPRDRGYVCLERGKYRLLLMKRELDSTVKERVVAGFAGRKNFRLLMTNVSSDKEYGGCYERFVGGVKLPEAYIDEMLGSKYARHFYTDAEIEAARSAWLRK
ncbi:MAG: putative capsular polysaccharide synthesis family protein [Candidatus Omnitrophota bacterium]